MFLEDKENLLGTEENESYTGEIKYLVPQYF